MKRILLTGVLSLGLLALSGTRYTNQALVCANCTQEVTEVLRWVDSMRQGAQTLAQVQQQVNQARAFYQQVTHVTDLGSAVSALGVVGIQNPLPVNPYALQSLLSGQGGANGMLSSLNGLYTGSLGQNTLTPMGTPSSWVGRLLGQQIGAASGTQAVSLQLFQTLSERNTLINQLRDRINTADPAQREALIARLSVEQNAATSLTGQAVAVGTYAAAQRDAFNAQREQATMMNIDAVLADAKSRGIY